ncbi:MAG: hypothetical protein HYZ37_14780 [Candidatus Solibacter usitatus]|nr:hypothetical protein [Candidatus Solibacter usitatus]
MDLHRAQYSAACFLLSTALLPAAGVELQIEYPAMRRVLEQQLLDASGRMYVQGSPASKCAYAFVSAPELGASDGRLEIRARFHGRSASNVFGFCLGLGDAFEIRIQAAPVFDAGMVRLKDVKVDTGGRDSFYARKVRQSMEENLPKKFAYNINEEARRLLEQSTGGPFRQQLKDFRVVGFEPRREALVVRLEFTLVVR